MVWKKRLLAWSAQGAVLAAFAFLAVAGDDRYAGVVMAPAWVTSVQDGDTITVRREDGQPQRVRLAGIDAPERAQPHGLEARQALATRVQGRHVMIRVRGRDRYGRWVGSIRTDGTDVGLWLVQGGWAWADRYTRDRRLRTAEQQARIERRGLWVAPSPVPPWAHRKRARPGT